MNNRATTINFYLNKPSFQEFDNTDCDRYMMMEKDNIQNAVFRAKIVKTEYLWTLKNNRLEVRQGYFKVFPV